MIISSFFSLETSFNLHLCKFQDILFGLSENYSSTKQKNLNSIYQRGLTRLTRLPLLIGIYSAQYRSSIRYDFIVNKYS